MIKNNNMINLKKNQIEKDFEFDITKNQLIKYIKEAIEN